MNAAPNLAAMPRQTDKLEPYDILTPEELAQRLKVKVSWVYKQSARSGPDSMPVLRCGMYLRFSWADVCSWLRSKNNA